MKKPLPPALLAHKTEIPSSFPAGLSQICHVESIKWTFCFAANSMKRAVRGNVMAETAIGVITNLLDFQPVGIEVHGNMTAQPMHITCIIFPANNLT